MKTFCQTTILRIAFALALWGSIQAPTSAGNLTVKITLASGGETSVTAKASLEAALEGIPLGEVKALEISAGDFTAEDWDWLREKGNDLNAMTAFTVTGEVGSVADYDVTRWNLFSKCITIYIAKLTRISAMGLFHSCTELTHVALPDVTSLGDQTFANCTSLEKVELPKVTSLGHGAFSGCESLKEVSFPLVTTIAESTFRGCSKLTTASLPALKSIGHRDAFTGCVELSALRLGVTPPSASTESFKDCPVVRTLTIVNASGHALPDGAAKNAALAAYRAADDGDTADDLWHGWALKPIPSSNLSGTLKKENGILIAEFNGKASLAEVLKGQKLEEIKGLTITGGKFQWRDWSYLSWASEKNELRLTKLEITDGVESVVNMPEGLPIGVDYTRVSIAKLKHISAGMFSYFSNLTNLTLPAATSIGNDAIKNCGKLTELTLPAVTTIGDQSITGCHKLTTLTLPAVTTIGDQSITSCDKLTTLTLPAVSSIGTDAISKCEALTTLRLGATPPAVGRGAFRKNPIVRKLEIVDASGKALPAGDARDKAIASYRKMNDGDTKDVFWYGWAFESSPSSKLSGRLEKENDFLIAEFTDAESIKEVLKGQPTSEIYKIEITKGDIQYLDWMYLKEASAQSLTNRLCLKRLTITTGVNSVANIPDHDSRDIDNCLPDIEQISIVKVKQVGKNAFGKYSPNLKYVMLPSVTSIRDSAFLRCKNVENIYLGTTPPTVGKNAFWGCDPKGQIIIVDAEGNLIPDGPEKKTAIEAYRKADDGDTEDNLWYGWEFEAPPSSNLSGEIKKADGTTIATFSGEESLRSAVEKHSSLYGEIKEIIITAGTIQRQDWVDLKDFKDYTPTSVKIDKFTVTEGATRVAEIPYFADTKLLAYASEISIAKLKEVGPEAFEGLSNLKSIAFPDATAIGDKAFKECRNLKSVALPRASTIGDEAFSYGSGLEEATLPAVTAIGVRAFNGCSGLKTLRLGAMPPSVGMNAFYSCSSAAALELVDANGAPLTGASFLASAMAYDAAEGDPNDGLWHGWKLPALPLHLGESVSTPAGAGSVVVKKKGSADALAAGAELAQGDLLEVTATPRDAEAYTLNEISAAGAERQADGSWKVTAASGKVVFTATFEAASSPAPSKATLGESVVTPAGVGSVAVKKKGSADALAAGAELAQGDLLEVTATPRDAKTYKLKDITAAGAEKQGDGSWKVTAASGEVVFTATFEEVKPDAVESTLLAHARIAPNPFTEELKIEAENDVARCDVYTAVGELVATVVQPGCTFRLALANAPAGIYLVRLIDTQGQARVLRAVKR